ncbi:MAG: leucyl aminopeptidase [Chitinophagales bacterium]|nr:leucyl aminopeptidase [Chitinophagales bacterium]
MASIYKTNSLSHTVLLIDGNHFESSQLISPRIIEILKKKSKKDFKVFGIIDEHGNDIIVAPFVSKENRSATALLEDVRTLGSVAQKVSVAVQLETISVASELSSELNFAFLEGFALTNYSFSKYKSNSSPQLKDIYVQENMLNDQAIGTLNHIVKSVFYARDIVNEPLSGLNAKSLSESAKSFSENVGIQYQELGIDTIRSLKMGGVLGVNKGSLNDPTFTVLEWKPENAVNTNPIVLVGKGVVYDSGGYSIKVGDGMKTMKCDMGGAAAVFGSIYLAALEKLPLHIITIVPAVENMINEKAIVPGDILTISDGTTVEVLNTDAEGRLILSDALVYARQFNPEFVFDFATLTGAAMRALGSEGAAFMGTASQEIKDLVQAAAYYSHERVSEMPLWEEYAEQLKSDIADISNLGGPLAGAITAGKFLEHFTKYPWLHFDIAATAFLSHSSSYRLAGGTGTGIRLMLEFFKRYIANVQK